MLPEGYELFSEEQARCVPWERARRHYAAQVHDWKHPGELMPEWFEAARRTYAGEVAVLDVGGGNGVVGQAFYDTAQVPVTILDAWWFPDRVQPVNLVLGDGREVDKIFAGRRFFWVQATEILEHMPKADGRAFLEALKRVTAHTLVVSTPFGFLNQPAIHGNPYEVHVSGWLPQELEACGFELYFNASQMFGFWRRGRE